MSLKIVVDKPSYYVTPTGLMDIDGMYYNHDVPTALFFSPGDV